MVGRMRTPLRVGATLWAMDETLAPHIPQMLSPVFRMLPHCVQ
jgi:hypothetical protein